MTVAPATYEGIADAIVVRLHDAGVLPTARPAPWDAFLRLSALVHARFEVPGTTLTPMMRRLLFALGIAAGPRHLVTLGSHYGYAMAWLLRDRADEAAVPFVETAAGVDVEARFNRSARRNCAVLGHGERVRFLTSDAVRALEAYDGRIDTLLLDIDDPVTGKRPYLTALLASRDRLANGALVLAHDPCVRRFASDFEHFHREIRAASWLEGPWVLPVDACGLSVAVVTEEAC